MLQHAEIFQSSSDGLGKVPEALSGNEQNEGPVIAAMQSYKKPATFSKKKQYRGPQNYEDDQDEPDPEWLEETVEEPAEDAFYNRVIPNEQEIRARVVKNKNPINYEDIEDALDELIQ